jgi:biopolymer transport protein ExbD
MPKLEPIPGPTGRSSGRRARAFRASASLAEINVVPLVDVMLVLLVIFMVAAPMMTQGFPVQLPQSRTAPAVSEAITVTVPLSFRRDQRVRLAQEAVPLSVLDERIRQLLAGRLQQSVLVAGDGGITIQELVHVTDQLKRGGVDKVSLQVQPAAGRVP